LPLSPTERCPPLHFLKFFLPNSVPIPLATSSLISGPSSSATRRRPPGDFRSCACHFYLQVRGPGGRNSDRAVHVFPPLVFFFPVCGLSDVFFPFPFFCDSTWLEIAIPLVPLTSPDCFRDVTPHVIFLQFSISLILATNSLSKVHPRNRRRTRLPPDPPATLPFDRDCNSRKGSRDRDFPST